MRVHLKKWSIASLKPLAERDRAFVFGSAHRGLGTYCERECILDEFVSQTQVRILLCVANVNVLRARALQPQNLLSKIGQHLRRKNAFLTSELA